MIRNKKNVQKLIDEGYTIRQLATVFDITGTPMRMWLKKNGLKTNHDRPRRAWTDKQLIDAVNQSIFMSDVIKRLGLTVRPGNYSHLKNHMRRLGLNTNQFTTNKGKYHRGGVTQQYSDDEVFVENSSYGRHGIKRRIMKQKLLQYKCSECNLVDWQNKAIVLVLDHINGIENDHRLVNLRFLCPNCNSQEPTFCRNKAT